jgi:hypothetical protein
MSLFQASPWVPAFAGMTGFALAKRATLCAALALASTQLANADEAWRKPLFDGFEGSDFAPEGGLYYKNNFEQSAGKVEFQGDAVRTGKGALKLSVKPICPPTDEFCSERAEIWEEKELRVPYDQGMWFGFAVKFADPVPHDDHRYLVAQWKREIDPGAEGDFSPFLALRLNEGKLFATVETNLVDGHKLPCAEGEAQAWLRPETNQTRALVAADPLWKATTDPRFDTCTDKITVTQRGATLPLPNSGWIDFAIYAKPGPDGSGRIEIFANGQWVVTVKGAIGHADKGLGANQYFKFGPYRAGGHGTWIMYYDDFRRSPDCKDVLVPASACPI